MLVVAAESTLNDSTDHGRPRQFNNTSNTMITPPPPPLLIELKELSYNAFCIIKILQPTLRN